MKNQSSHGPKKKKRKNDNNNSKVEDKIGDWLLQIPNGFYYFASLRAQTSAVSEETTQNRPGMLAAAAPNAAHVMLLYNVSNFSFFRNGLNMLLFLSSPVFEFVFATCFH